MKKICSIILCMLLLLPATVCNAEQAISVELDNVPIEFDQEPIIMNSRTMVPVRAIFEAMGASVTWDEKTKTVTSSLDDVTVMMVINNPVMFVNAEMKTIDAPPVIVNSRTLVPVRAVSESFGCTVEWNESKRIVSIYSKDHQGRLSETEDFGCVKQLTNGVTTATAAFGISYFPEYEVKTNTADGTNIEICHTTSTGHVALNVRTDLYDGNEEALTDEYVKSVAEGVVSVLSGTLISHDVVTLSGLEFMEITYTAPAIVHGITDMKPETTIYMGRKNGVMYTMTYIVHGDVDSSVLADFETMIQTLVVA